MYSKDLASDIKSYIKMQLEGYDKFPRLAVLLVGDDHASSIYVRNKEKDCKECGIGAITITMSSNTPLERVESWINEMNHKDDCDGILIQLPLPEHLREHQDYLLNLIDENKDVDCFRVDNIGRLYKGKPLFMPCTPAGIIELLDYYNIEISGKNCVVIGRSDIVGKPMAQMLLQRNGTVTICHSKTVNLKDYTSRADILVSAVGKAKFITEDMVKEGSVIVDVGMNTDDSGKLCGDVDFNNVIGKVSAITPVPGGVGPMTRAILMKNIYSSYINKLMR